MTGNDAGSGASGLFSGGFGWGGVLLVLGMVLALAVVSGLGILARMRDRATERRAHPAGIAAAPVGSGLDDGRGDEIPTRQSAAP